MKTSAMVRTIVAVALLISLAIPAIAQLTGAVFTTDATGNAVNANIYTRRLDVYVNGGPRKAGAAGLPNGAYYVKITEPDGTLLGSSTFRANQTPVQVLNGEFVQLYQLWSIVNKASNPNEQGFDATSNPGGQYKVWVSNVPVFASNASKTDSFKVRGEVQPPPPPPPPPPGDN